MTNITAATIHNWKKSGKLTDGVRWDLYRERHEEKYLQQTKTRDLSKSVEGETAFLEEVKKDLREVLYAGVVSKIQAGDFHASTRDFTEIVKLYNMLENGASEKMAFAHFFVGKIMEVVVDMLDDRQFAAFKLKIDGIQTEVEAKLNPLSITHQIT